MPRRPRRIRPAVGVPRRFGVGTLVLVTTMFAVLFAAMRTYGVHPITFGAIAVFFAGVGLAQAVLFVGRSPRAASVVAGAVLTPALSLGIGIWVDGTPPLSLAMIACVFLAILGAGLGYLAGGLTAGVFLVVEPFWRIRAEDPAASENERGQEKKRNTSAV